MHLERPIQPGLSAAPSPNPVRNIMLVESKAPFASNLYWHIQLYDASLDQLAKNDRYTLPYLAWETVRRRRNPFFIEGTGLEGYLVGQCHSGEEALEKLLALCHETLDVMARRYEMDYGFRTRLMKTLTGETSDYKALDIWALQLSIMLAKLRCNLNNNQEATRFRSETYQIVSQLPRMYYRVEEHIIRQRYELGAGGEMNGCPKLDIHLTSLKPNDQEAWLLAGSIGRFGHPLVRQVLLNLERG